MQTAFREVADGRAGRRMRLAVTRYRAGLDGRIEVLDAQRSLYGAQQALITLRQEQASL